MIDSQSKINFIISCRTLISFQGHDYAYCKSLRKEALQRGWNVLVLANKLLDKEIMQELDAIPFYTVDLGKRFDVPFIRHFLPKKISKLIYLAWNFILHNFFTYLDLFQIKKYLSKLDHNLILFPTMTISNLFSIVKFFESISTDYDKLNLAFVNHFTSRPDLESSPFPDKLHCFLYNQINRSKIENKIFLFCDTPQLSKEFSIYTKKNIEVLPIPHNVEHGLDYQGCKTKSLKIGYLGDARNSKGFNLLPDVLQKYNERHNVAKVDFLIQCSIRVRMQKECLSAIKLLEAIDGTTLFRESLSSKDYEMLFNSLDIVLLPYSSNMYHSQTSGIFSEARALGKVLIVPANTWMSEEVSLFGGGVIFNSHNPDAIESSLNKAIQNYSTFSLQSKKRSVNWKLFHNSNNYFTSFLNSLIFKSKA